MLIGELYASYNLPHQLTFDIKNLILDNGKAPHELEESRTKISPQSRAR